VSSSVVHYYCRSKITTLSISYYAIGYNLRYCSYYIIASAIIALSGVTPGRYIQMSDIAQLPLGPSRHDTTFPAPKCIGYR